MRWQSHKQWRLEQTLCASVSDECRSQVGRVFHEVGPDDQNARGPMDAVSDLGMKSLLSSKERRCGQPYKLDRRTHTLVRYSGARPCKHVYTSKASLYVIRCRKSSQWRVSCMAAETGAWLGRESMSLAADWRTPCSRAIDCSKCLECFISKCLVLDYSSLTQTTEKAAF